MACTSNDPAGGASYDSVRDRLSDGPTRLVVGADSSSGTLTARRRTADGWVEGVTQVTIAGGDLAAKVDDKGALTIDKLVLQIAPIDIPEEVFHKPAQLDDVKLTLTSAATADATWTNDDDATATLPVALDFDWTILINGTKTPLGTQHLPPVLLDVALTGAGDHVDAALTLRASGELWNWAGLLEMTELDLSLAASTAD